jgi:tRNA threonylcarbamoyl adenosine modification protein YeaZ
VPFSKSDNRSGSPTGPASLANVCVLALDTSSPVLTVAVTGPNDVSVTRAERAPNKHGERLMPLVDEALREANVHMRELAAVGVGLGPGPFTGLRVGVVTAAALADALGLPAYGLCSLDSIATSVADGSRGFAVVTDARRRQVYWATYDAEGHRLDGPSVDLPSDVASHLTGRTSVVVGAGAEMYADVFSGFEIVTDEHPDASVIAGAALTRHRAGDPADVLEPLYLRRPDAVPPAALKKVTPA